MAPSNGARLGGVIVHGRIMSLLWNPEDPGNTYEKNPERYLCTTSATATKLSTSEEKEAEAKVWAVGTTR